MPSTTTKILSSLRTVSLYTTAGASAGFVTGLTGGTVISSVRDMMTSQGFERQIDNAFKAAHNGNYYEAAVAQNPGNSKALTEEIMRYQNFYYDKQADQFNNRVYWTTAITTLTGGLFGFYTGVKKALGYDTAPIQAVQELKSLKLADKETSVTPQLK